MTDSAERPSKEDAAYARGVRDTGVALTEMVDICDHALAALEDMNAPAAVAGGIEAAREQLVAQFEKIGLESVYPIGEQFDPMQHEAIGVEACDDEAKDGLIFRVHRRGWLQDGLVVRAAMVSVWQAVTIPEPSPSATSAVPPADGPPPETLRQQVRRTPAQPPKPAAPADSPSARRRRQRDQAGTDSFSFTYPPEKKER